MRSEKEIKDRIIEYEIDLISTQTVRMDIQETLKQMINELKWVLGEK